MRKIFISVCSIIAIVFSIMPTVSAATVYVPSSESDQYLPTVKILSYSLGYDGSLVPEAYGSGTLIDNKGTILTNNHVIQSALDPSSPNDAFQVCLTVSNDSENPVCEFTASLVARDPAADLALLRMDSNDVRGKHVSFDFYLPYDNSGSPEVSDTVTVLGYPDTGGRTITFTQGVVSGFLNEGGVRYIKTDADISFGNSGGTAVDTDGNFIGVPTFIVGSGSSEVLGYLIPVAHFVKWIDSNRNGSIVDDSAGKGQLRDAMKANIQANNSGTYKNKYPPYEISVVDGWKFGNSLEGAFEGDSYGLSTGDDSVIIYPKNISDMTTTYFSVSVTDYAYEVSLDDIEYLLGAYSDDVYVDNYGSGSTYERVKLNNRFDAVKELLSYYDWWTGVNLNTVTYYVPYGDKVINVGYSYAEGADVADMEAMLRTFDVDMSKVDFSIVKKVQNKSLGIKVVNPLADAFLSDSSYEYDGVDYFGVSFGKKRDYGFFVSIYSNEYWNEDYKGNFDAFKKATMTDADTWYDIVSKGELKLDGHKGFYFTDEYDSGYGDVAYYSTVYIENTDNNYFSVSYSGTGDSFVEGMDDFKAILNAIELSNGGSGVYLIPDLMGGGSGGPVGAFNDIKHYVYEANIKSLSKAGAFGENADPQFKPESAMSRLDFVVWAIRGAEGAVAENFAAYKASYVGCGDKCYADVGGDSVETVYLEFAKSEGVIADRDRFHPDEQISLMAAFKIMFELYDYDIWDAPDYVLWYIPYLHVGYINGFMPYGVDTADHELTRGEAAFIIDAASFGSVDDFGFDDSEIL